MTDAILRRLLLLMGCNKPSFDASCPSAFVGLGPAGLRGASTHSFTSGQQTRAAEIDGEVQFRSSCNRNPDFGMSLNGSLAVVGDAMYQRGLCVEWLQKAYCDKAATKAEAQACSNATNFF